MGTHQTRDMTRDNVQMELLGRNAFLIAMIGAVSFFTACFSVMMH